MLKKRASTRVQFRDAQLASASAPPGNNRRGSGSGDQAVSISTDDLYWLASEQHRQSLQRNAIYRILSRLSAARRTGIDSSAHAKTEIERKSDGFGAYADTSEAAQPPALPAPFSAGRSSQRLPPLTEPSESITSDRAFYLGYAPRNVRFAPPSVGAELLGRHACEVLGAQACHACTAEAARLRSQALLGGGASSAFSAVTIAKATKLKKLLADDRPLRLLQEQIERGEIASGSFLSSRSERLAAAATGVTGLHRPGDGDSVTRDAAERVGAGGVRPADHQRPPRDRRTLFFADLRDLREKIRFGVIPSAVVPNEDAERSTSLRRLRPVDSAAVQAASESFQRIYYAPPLLTVEQQSVQSTFFAGCSAKYSLPPPLPDSIAAAPGAAAAVTTAVPLEQPALSPQ